MIIALDYDGTYTRDPAMWNEFIKLAESAGHDVVIVTKRYNSEEIESPPAPVHYMSRRDKIHCQPSPDIWIDNNPFDITGYP